MNNEYRDIVSFDGTLLKCLIRETGSSQWLIVTHGLGEHLGRHEYMLKLFAQNFNIAIYDLRGHGRSGGKRGYIENFEYFLKDLHSIIDYLKKEFSLTKYNLFGHSMGGLITAAYVQNMAPKDFYPEKVYLSSPAVAAGGILGPVFASTPRMLFDLLCNCPSLPLQGMLDLKKLSHDSRVYEDYIVNCPLFCSIGTEDILVNPKLCIEYFSKIEKNAQLKIIEDGYHELHNEIEKYRKPYLDFLRQSLTGLTPQLS